MEVEKEIKRNLERRIKKYGQVPQLETAFSHKIITNTCGESLMLICSDCQIRLEKDSWESTDWDQLPIS